MPEFSWSWDLARGCWVIKRHGQHYLDVPGDYPMTYVLRITRTILNGEKS